MSPGSPKHSLPSPRAPRVGVLGAFCLLGAGGFAAFGLARGGAPAIGWAASGILFGQSTKEALLGLDEQTFLDVFDGVPQALVSADRLAAGIPVMDFVTEDTGFLPSKGEARRTIEGGGLNINQEKIGDPEMRITPGDLIAGKYILVRKGKKNFSLAVIY